MNKDFKNKEYINKGLGSNTNERERERETLVTPRCRMIINLLLLHNVIIGKDVICVHYSRQGKVKGKDNKVLRATGNHT